MLLRTQQTSGPCTSLWRESCRLFVRRNEINGQNSWRNSDDQCGKWKYVSELVGLRFDFGAVVVGAVFKIGRTILSLHEFHSLILFFVPLQIYHDLCTTGLLNTTINQWVTLSFCLPHKAHQAHKKGIIVEPEKIDRCLQSLKPYHGMLLLVDLTELLDCVPPSGARMLLQLINAYNPLKTLQNMANEADLAINHVYELVGHLVYWAKATIIYPLCETNV